MKNTISFQLFPGSLLFLVLVFFCPFWLTSSFSAYSENPGNDIAAVAQVKIDKSSEGEFSYNPVGKRDPFEPLITKTKPLSKGKIEKAKGPLEKFELGQFRLLAMLLVKGTPRAMVKAPDGKSYIVKPGDKIGKLDGVIVNIETKVVDPVSRAVISPDRIVIKEVGFDPFTNKDVIEFRNITM